MAVSLYFYDLETSGINPRSSRIMQFAGQRTDLDLNPIGEPDNFLIKLTNEILPEPDAILITGITPQATITDGITEAEFVRFINDNVCVPGTIIIGFNNVRFDDEFMRFTLWRNFNDPYEWCWKDGRSRWDILDLVRMTRALRPDGIKWPFSSDGKATNRLELLSGINGLDHEHAHDALNDVLASVAVAKLIKSKQPRLFDYLFNLRDKKKVEALINDGKPLVYTSGRYPSEFEKTTVAVKVANNPFKQGALMYDLRVDPDDFTKLSVAELAKLWSQWGKDAPYFPVKTLTFNRCPAVAPLSVLDDSAKERIKLDMDDIKNNVAKLQKAEGFGDKLVEVLESMQSKKQTGLMVDENIVDEMLYEGFVPDEDRPKLSVVRAADKSTINDLSLDFKDDRLKALFPIYKARNFPKSLNEQELEHWEKFRTHRLMDGGVNSKASKYFARISELGADASGERQYLLEELNLYGQAIIPFS
jgi:exodeoxyribonuclease I